MTMQNENEIKSLSVNDERFLNKINEIKKFSENLPTEVALPVLEGAEGFFKWFKQDVKANDINELTEKIQDRMIEQNKVILSVVQEFKNIYETFSILNKDYILKIVASLNAAEEANRNAIQGLNEINKSNAEISKSNEELKKQQRKLDSLLKQQGLIINSLKKFKQELEEIKHLKNIDVMFELMTNNQEKLNEVGMIVDSHQYQLEGILQSIKEIQLNSKLYLKNLEEFTSATKVQFESFEEKNSQHERQVNSLEATNTENKTLINLLLNDFANYEQKSKEINEDNEKKITTINECIDNILQTNVAYKNKIEQDIQTLQEKSNNEDKKIVAQFETEFSYYKKELENLNGMIAKLSKKLELTKIISFIAISILLILFLFYYNGVF